MRNVTVAVVQMQCAKEVEANIAKADAMVREAAAKGAKIILLPELFERPYFCQERQYEYYAYATPTAQNPAVQHFRAVAKELGVVLPISFYEKAGTQLFNSIAVLDADGTLLGVYRKTHIPDDHYYQEKFYFTPGDTGFKVWDTRFGRIGEHYRLSWKTNQPHHPHIPAKDAAPQTAPVAPAGLDYLNSEEGL